MSQLRHASFPVFGTGAVVATVNQDALDRAVATVRDVCAEFDAACSGFRHDSDVERVNREAGNWVAVGPLFLSALSEALRVAAATGGDVDPTVGRAVHALGYDRDFAAVDPDGPAVVGVRPAPGFGTVQADHRGRVRIPPGIRLDLGATAKALAADRAAAAASYAAGCGVLVSLGGDVAVAGPAPADGWPVLVTDDHAAGRDASGQTVAVRAGGLATSGTTVRRWRRGTVSLHHIVDPASGRPAEPCWRTVSVAAGSCVDANVAATASVVRGAAAPGWLATTGLAARLVRDDGTVVLVGGWPTADGR